MSMPVKTAVNPRISFEALTGLDIPLVSHMPAKSHTVEDDGQTTPPKDEVLKTNIVGRPAITALHLAVRLDCTTREASKVQDRFPSIF